MRDVVATTTRWNAHELAMMNRDAADYGMPSGRFMVALWRDWRTRREPLRLIPPLPADPWIPKQKAPEKPSL